MAKVLNPNSNGISIKNAIIIEAKTLDEGIKEEYRFLERKFGKRGKDWQMVMAAFDFKYGKAYDVLYLVFSEEKEPKDRKIDPKDFIWEGLYPFYFHIMTPKEKFKGDTEKIRNAFKPEKVKVLLIGESPPPEKWRFFYNCDSTLYYTTKKVFEKVFKKEFDDQEFLELFENKGFYLVDLYRRKDIWKKKNGKFGRIKKPSEIPEKLIKKRLEELRKKIKKFKPKFVITIGKTFVSGVIEKFDEKIYEKIDLELPFPKYRYKKEFMKKFARWLRNHMNEM